MNIEKFFQNSYRPTLVAVSLMSCAIAGAYHVSTESELKHILFEEGTGINCTSCAWVEPKLQKVQTDYPDLNMIAIHGHDFASDNFNLTTPEGDEIVDYFDIKSYPQAMINRTKFEGMNYHFLSDVFWNNFLPSESKKVAPVNLWMRSWLSEDNNIVVVEVEGYCREDISASEPFLSVVMTQDGILAPQKGQSSDMYTHDHVLRDFLTPTWGVEIGDSREGDYFKMVFEYPLPEKIGIFKVVPENLNFVAFVTEGKENVMNSTASRLTYGTPEDYPGDDENTENPGDDNGDDNGDDLDPEPGEDDATTGLTTVADNVSGVVNVYDINGRVVLRNPSATDLNLLENGLYILNGRKLIIRK